MINQNNMTPTPKEKAKDLVFKYYVELKLYIGYYDIESAKQCALIAIDEMLSNDGWSSSCEEWDRFKKYCEQVKHEINKSE